MQDDLKKLKEIHGITFDLNDCIWCDEYDDSVKIGLKHGNYIFLNSLHYVERKDIQNEINQHINGQGKDCTNKYHRVVDVMNDEKLLEYEFRLTDSIDEMDEKDKNIIFEVCTHGQMIPKIFKDRLRSVKFVLINDILKRVIIGIF